MFFDIGWPELMLIGVVALVVIGPKDLPRALKVAGFWVRKARMLSREFQGSIEQMIREAELDDMRQQLKKATEFDLEKEFNKTVDPTGSLAESIRPPDIPDFFESPPLPMPATEPAGAVGDHATAAQQAAESDLAALPAPDDEPPLPGLEMPPTRKPEPSSL